jgi:hypothetical protein
VQAVLFDALCAIDARGQVPLEAYLEATGAPGRRDALPVLAATLDDPESFARAFLGVANAQSRALPTALHELAVGQGEQVERALARRRASTSSRMRCVAMLEVPDEIRSGVVTAVVDGGERVAAGRILPVAQER